MEKDKDLFGNDVPRTLFIQHSYFKAVKSSDDDGWMQMYCCGQSCIDNKEYVVTTNHLHADEVPTECTDAKTFSELVARLLNDYYNKKTPVTKHYLVEVDGGLQEYVAMTDGPKGDAILDYIFTNYNVIPK